MIGNKRRFDLCTLEVGASRDKEQSSDSRASSSNHVAGRASASRFGGKYREGSKGVLVSAAEVKLIDERLRKLEEETKVMKKAFLESMEGKKLMNEIYQQFQVIHQCLHSKNQSTVERSSDGVLIINPHKVKNGGTRTGLSQVLREKPNPSLVIRNLRAALSYH